MLKEENILNYIESNWDNCITENYEDSGTLIGLPYPYTTPTVHTVADFKEMYYWDTYFTNIGLAISGRMDQAKNNTDNMIYLVEKYGFMPNGNRTFYLNRSQPPYLSLMIRDVYDFYKDKEWLSRAYAALDKEYSFWMTNRITPTGLNRFDSTLTEADIEEYSNLLIDRIGYAPAGTPANLARHMLVTAESGWDINPCWGFEGYNYNHISVNSLLYALECNMAYFSAELGNGLFDVWNERSKCRIEKMNKYLTDENNLYFDYNFESKKHSEVYSSAAFYPLFTGAATDEQAKSLVDNLSRLEADYGILVCEKNDVPGTYQWNYPNGWACMQYIAIIGLDKYGYKKEARRIAEKYTALVENIMETTNNLWEKYNVVEGNINVVIEEAFPPMMGWSAGVYLAAKEYLKNS